VLPYLQVRSQHTWSVPAKPCATMLLPGALPASLGARLVRYQKPASSRTAVVDPNKTVRARSRSRACLGVLTVSEVEWWRHAGGRPAHLRHPADSVHTGPRL